MNPEMDKVIRWYVDNDKISRFRIYTNGTIIPDEHILETLSHDKVHVRISDYGINQRQIGKLKEVLEKNKISYYVTSYSDWQDSGDLRFRNYSVEQMREIFSKCYERNCITFLKGQLHRCPRSAHAMNLEAMPIIQKDFIDLKNWQGTDDELKKSISEFQRKDYVMACNYCDGPNRNTQHIPAAIQIESPRYYEKYMV